VNRPWFVAQEEGTEDVSSDRLVLVRSKVEHAALSGGLDQLLLKGRQLPVVIGHGGLSG